MGRCLWLFSLWFGRCARDLFGLFRSSFVRSRFLFSRPHVSRAFWKNPGFRELHVSLLWIFSAPARKCELRPGIAEFDTAPWIQFSTSHQFLVGKSITRNTIPPCSRMGGFHHLILLTTHQWLRKISPEGFYFIVYNITRRCYSMQYPRGRK